MEYHHNGITYQIDVSAAECDRRVGHLLAALSRPVIASEAKQSPPTHSKSPTPADGAETQSNRSHEHAPANPSQPRFPVRVTDLTRAGTSFLPCGTGGSGTAAASRKGATTTIEFSEPGNRETAKKRPPR